MDNASQDGSPAPSPAGLKKVFSRPSRNWTTNDFESMSSSGRSASVRPSSADSNGDQPRPQTSGGADDSAKGISKLLPGARRRRRKRQGTESSVLLTVDDDSGMQRSRAKSLDEASVSAASSVNGPADNEAADNLLSDDSDPEATPPLASHNSDTGFYTSTSPLITTTHVDDDDPDAAPANPKAAMITPNLHASESTPDLSLKTFTHDSMLDAPVDNAKRRGVSPGRRLKDAFTPSQDQKSVTSSPERTSAKSTGGKEGRSLFGDRGRKNSLSAKRAAKAAESPTPPVPKPIRIDNVTPTKAPATDAGPRTPPAESGPAPATTVTPPTPTEVSQVVTSEVTASPEAVQSPENLPPDIVVSPSGNTTSHRRARSASAANQPSKLSNPVSLDAAVEEAKASAPKTPSALQTGFFSSMFSAAQNAISNSLNAQARIRSATQPAPAHTEKLTVDGTADEDAQSGGRNSSEGKKELAVDTLGMGDLNLSHFETDAAPGGVVTTKDGIVITRPDAAIESRKNMTALQRDELAARNEDMRVAQAISMAYEKPAEVTSATPPLAPGDGLEVCPSAAIARDGSGDQASANGSIFEGETGAGSKRSESGRDRSSKRRPRGSSGATGSSAGATGASATAVGISGANTSAPRLTGFAVASKKRNRDFHQLFRSVPEDDYLIEDYSCALQREIILAGRIYISEGHICFSSNILGWVTTLVISFDEIVAIEKETTAMVFPNAIAIQTLHARHTFRSLLSRESTYDLMVNIWKINHPSLKSSVNGTRIDQGTGDKTEKADDSAGSDESDEEDEVYDEDEEGDAADSYMEAGDGSAGSEKAESIKPLSRKASGLVNNGNGPSSSSTNLAADTKGGDTAGAAGADAAADFPGPATHPPTEFNDPSGRYEKVVKDEVIPAPLGKIYSLVFGPASGAFMSKFLVEDQKATELQFEDDKKGLTNENKTRQYSYIKPLNGSIGPKQTKCISTETLDFFDLEKAVLVTLSTQTPDVPSGNVFCIKTKYLFTWAPGNATRFFMSCTIEWSGKSWIKGPIEKGANEGQVSFGNDLVRALKAAVGTPAQPNGAPKSKGKGGKGKRKKGDTAASVEAAAAAAESAAPEASKQEAENWGMFEPLRAPLAPVVSVVKPLLKPLWNGNVAVGVIAFLLFMIFIRGSSSPPPVSHGVAYPGLTIPQRLAAYEEMWRREESELWNWLEERVGLDGLNFPVVDTTSHESLARQREQRRRLRAGRDLAARMNEERMSEREMDHAIRVVRERLEVLEEVMRKRKLQRQQDEDEMAHSELKA